METSLDREGAVGTPLTDDDRRQVRDVLEAQISRRPAEVERLLVLLAIERAMGVDRHRAVELLDGTIGHLGVAHAPFGRVRLGEDLAAAYPEGFEETLTLVKALRAFADAAKRKRPARNEHIEATATEAMRALWRVYDLDETTETAR